GAKIRVYGGPVPLQSQEMISGGRYLSCDQAMRVFAAGSLTNQLRIEVDWPGGKRSIVTNAVANYLYEIDEAAAMPRSRAGVPPALPGRLALESPNRRETPRDTGETLPPRQPAFFEDVSRLLQHTHHEDPF